MSEKTVRQWARPSWPLRNTLGILAGAPRSYSRRRHVDGNAQSGGKRCQMSRWMNAACALLFAGRAPKALPPLAYSQPEPLPPRLAATEVLGNCLKQEIEPQVAAVWAERAARGEYPDLPTTNGT